MGRNRKGVWVPRRMLDELMLALDQCVGRLQDPVIDPARDQQVVSFAQRTVEEARRRATAQEHAHSEG